jgi:hypothetical protein
MSNTRRNRNNRNNTIKNRKKSKRIFTKKDYSSGDGMLTGVWGPPMWHFLHTMSFNYPIHPTAEDKQHYKDFVVNLQYILPCKYCRMNLTNNFKKKPLQMCDMESRETFSKYIYELHELVNKMLKKKSHLSYCDVRERYEHFRSRCTEENQKVFNFKRETSRNKTLKKEKGCTEPLYGKKSKCVINIVPVEDKSATFQMDKKCIKTRDPNNTK